MYLGGLLIGLAAGLAFMKLKHAMMPKFHEVQETREEVTLAPAANIHFAYAEDPGYFLIPGLPSAAVLYKRNDTGQPSLVTSFGYGQLVDKEPVLGPVTEEGNYNLVAELYICAEPGVADCTKLILSQDLHVDRNATLGDDRIEINLSELAQEGLKAGNATLPPMDESTKPTGTETKQE